MSENPNESWLNSFLSVGKIVTREQHVRFEHIAGVFTGLALLLALISVQLPFGQAMDKKVVYPFVIVVGFFCIVWFLIIPRRFTGLAKNLIHTVLVTLYAAFLIHTNPTIGQNLVLLYYVIAVAAAVAMPTFFSLTITILVIILIYTEWFLAGATSAGFTSTIIYTTGLLIVVFYTRSLAGEAAYARKKEEEVHLEKEKTLSKLKDEYIFIISHKLKQPTSAIKGYTDEIIKEYSQNLDSESKETLEFIKTNDERLEKLLDDLLDISQIEKGIMRINLTDVSLSPVISEVLSNLFLDAQSKKISLLERGDLNTAVKADSDRLKEVLMNLVGNAIKYTPDGGKVTIEVKKEELAAKLFISDSGIGISPQDQKYLFEKFFRAENEKTKAIKGNGLGLFITKQLVEKMGGEVGVSSEFGRGSTFFFTLPRYRW